MLISAHYIICERMWYKSAFEEASLHQSMESCMLLQLPISDLRRTAADVPLESCLKVLRQKVASDPRDKGYSVLGMLADQRRQKYAIVPS
jgi:hypothetical protein